MTTRMYAFLVILLVATVEGQTTDYLGYPDTAYSKSRELEKFSCEGGPAFCPFNGQYAYAGGSLTVTILEMVNLPNEDDFGLTGIATDAYVRASIGDNVRTSSVINNDLNPKWPPCSLPKCAGDGDVVRDLDFGFRKAGTELLVEVLDADSGFAFGDDPIWAVRLHTIYCSAYTAPVQAIPDSEASSWQMPRQPLCVEERWVPLTDEGTCIENGQISTTTPCMRLRMTALPFQIRVEETFVSGSVVNGGMGGYFPNQEAWIYGRVYSASNLQLNSYYRMLQSSGGHLVRSDSASLNDKGNSSLISRFGYAPYARITTNFDSKWFVFRRVDDIAAVPLPNWLNSSYNWTEEREWAQLVGVAGDFQAVARNVSAHPINKYGDAFDHGVITGMNVPQNYTEFTLSMYFIVLVPHEFRDIIPIIYSKDFDRGTFIKVSLWYSPNLFLAYLVFRYLQRMNWRIERVQSYLATKVVNETEVTNAMAGTTSATKTSSEATSKVGKGYQPRNVVSQLLTITDDSEDTGIEFRRNLFYSKIAVALILASPLLTLISWGVTCIYLVTPPAFGYGLIFLGVGGLLACYGTCRWVEMGWRMTGTVLKLLAIFIVFIFIFLLCSTFTDPRVYIDNEDLDFFSLTATFLSLNMMPLIWLAFTNDRKLTMSLSNVLKDVSTSRTPQKHKSGSTDQLNTRRKASVFQPLMGDHYTIERSIPGFRYADILQNAFVTSPEKRKRMNVWYYASAVALLMLYCTIAAVKTIYGAQSVGVLCTVVLVDACIYMMHRGYLTWSPGRIVFLMSSVRTCLVATCGTYWILGHACLFMVFGTALCREIIGKNLPRMNKQEAGGVTFFGHDYKQKKHLDLSTTPEFALGFLSFFYIFLLLAVAFGTDPDDEVRLPVFGQKWPLWVFGVIAFIVVLFVGISLATSRAFFLQKEQLLTDYAANVYLFVKPFKLPFILAAASEILVICAGLFVYASTLSTFVLVTSIFLPLILMLMLAVYSQWQKNDYRLVIWPPEESEEDFLNEEDILDVETAMEREAELMRETFVLPSVKEEEANIFQSDTGFTMPTLPPKHLLEKKALLEDTPDTSSDTKQAGETSESHVRRARKSYLLSKGRKSKQQVDTPDATSSVHQSDPPKTSAQRNVKSLLALFWRQAVEKLNFLPALRSVMSKRPGFTKNQRFHAPSFVPTLFSSHVSGPEVKEEASKDERDDVDVDFAQMTLYDAYQQGYLLPEDYMTISCFVSLLALLFLYGVILSATETPSWLGHLIWTGSYFLLFTLAPTFKYFRIAETTEDMKYTFGFGYSLGWITGFVLFFAVLKASVNQAESLVILSVLVLYPIFLLFIVTLVKWKDEQFLITRPTRRILSLCSFFIAFWIMEMYVYVGVVFGAFLTFIASLGIFVSFLLLKWIQNDMYLSPFYQRRANLSVLGATCMIIAAGLFFGLDFFYCLSFAFIVLIVKYMLLIVANYFMGKDDTELFYTPYLFPVFSYNAYTNNVVEETSNVRNLYIVLGLFFMWGVAGVMFFDPLGFGIGMCSLSLLTFAVVTSHLCAVTPVRMAIAAKYVNDMILKDASVAAMDAANIRSHPFVLECQEFVELARQEELTELEFQAIAIGGAAATAFAKKKKELAAESSMSDNQEKDYRAVSRETAGDVAIDIDDMEHSLYSKSNSDDGQGLFTCSEIYEEIFLKAHGPFGFLYGATLPFRLYRFLEWKYFPAVRRRREKRARARKRAQLNAENDASMSEADDLQALEQGKNEKVEKWKSSAVLVESLLTLPKLDKKLDIAFYEETRCVIHFQLLLLTAADARLNREKILFQQFLRENRFKLMSNSINPPANIFKTSSFASIDIPLVAIWLLSLSPEQRARFHSLKNAFNKEMERMDTIIDAEDAQSLLNQRQLLEKWRPREEDQCHRRMQEFHARRLRRQEEGIRSDGDVDESLLNAQEAIMEIESGYSCKPGHYGRSLQYVDKEFTPDEESIADCSCEQELGGWKVSTAINIAAGLFDGGTDPDDVRVGRLRDEWLLSAISIMAASGGVDDGRVDPLIDQIFITKQTSLTGAYAIRLFKNCQWETVIVDDYFPVLSPIEEDDDAGKALVAKNSNGAAFAHSLQFNELWVPLLEKAIAKYYGGYAALEAGYVHHGLEMLTGYPSEEVFLAPASRGSFKTTLWKQLLVYKSNQFLMGAGTIDTHSDDSAAALSAEIRASGLVFGACYVIYDVRDIDGYRLLKLRNPPGDHPEWQGDWSDNSRLWNRRLKKLLGFQGEDSTDNTFWMSFDDFCHAFRCLYICRYYDPVKWPVVVKCGQWAKETACGLPTVHNPQCAVDCNPQYALSTSRPTEVILTVTQVDEKGLAPLQVLPIAVYIVKGAAADRASRVKELGRDNVVAHTGTPSRQREVRIQCELPARTYTVLVAAYKRGMEGPFRLRVQSNYAVEVNQLWPALWKQDGERGMAMTMAEKMATKMATSSFGQRLKEKTDGLAQTLAKGAAVMANALKDEEQIIEEEIQKEEKEEKIVQARLQGKKVKDEETPTPSKGWIEQWDAGAGKPFYYNRQTGMSCWEKPKDF